MNTKLWVVLMCCMLLTTAPVAWAQGDDPPAILSSELAQKTVLESDELEVNFAIVDTNQIVEVRIDGKPVDIVPGDTVLVTRTFRFQKDVTRLEVSATDENGNTRTEVYTVLKPGVDPTTVADAPAPGASKLRTFATYDVRFEMDSNPSNDLSSPIKIGDIELVGVVADSKQDDTRTNMVITGGVARDAWAVFGGVTQISYSDEVNKTFELTTGFLGGSYTFPRSKIEEYVLRYTYLYAELAGFKYQTAHTIAPAWRTRGTDSDGDATTTTWGLDLTAKAFESSGQDDVTVVALRRVYSAVDKAQQDSYRSAYAIGNSSEGVQPVDVSAFNYLSADWDWRWRWDSGLLFNLGTGVQYRKYDEAEALDPDTFLGETRADVPARFSTAVGWHFSDAIRVLGRYRYVFNLSNKSPYVRQIMGIGVEGRF